MNWADKKGQLSLDDKGFAHSEAQVIVALFVEYGVERDALLRDAALDCAALYAPQARISLRQQLGLHAAGLRRCGRPEFALAAGCRLHLTAYDMVGYALLSSVNLEQALRVVRDYALLLNMKFDLGHRIVGDEAVISFTDTLPLAEPERAACLELDIAKTVTLLRDLLGGAFTPREVRVDVASRAAGACERLLGCVMRCNARANEIRFDACLLTRPLPQAHALTHRNCLQACDGAMAQIAQARELPHHVERMLLDADGRMVGLADVAGQLCVSPRTLRRRLESLNTSYAKIVEDVRKTRALRYLSTTSLTTEVIAERLGYSDAANFRHAFKRWTGHSPRQFRLSHGAAAHTPGAVLSRAIWPRGPLF